ncbi:hypothetical protein ASB1_16640 [Helicobacter heilmannii]|nr:hypothetical protein ASB1_16640 [Helicobacter heilmannii]
MGPGEFLRDVFIMMVEVAPSISYTIGNRFSVGVAGRGLYATGSFNNTVYVPLHGASVLKGSQIIGLPNNVFSQQVPAAMRQQLASIGWNPAITCAQDMNQNSTPCEAYYNGLKEIMRYSGLQQADSNLYGTSQVVQQSNGSAWSGGYRAAASMRVFDNGMFSVVYNSSVTFNMHGDLTALTELGPSLGNVLTKGHLNINVSLPEMLDIAYAHEFFKHHLRIEGVYRRTFWSQGNKFLVTPTLLTLVIRASGGLCSI